MTEFTNEGGRRRRLLLCFRLQSDLAIEGKDIIYVKLRKYLEKPPTRRREGSGFKYH